MLASNALRPARAFATGLRPVIFAPCSASNAAPFSTSQRPTPSQRTQRPSAAAQATSPIHSAIRHASTSPGASAAAANTRSTASSSAANAQAQLTWAAFFDLRRRRRIYDRAASTFTALGITYAGLTVFIQQGYDATLAATLSLDPLLVAGLSTMTLLSAGWLVGPALSTQFFRVSNMKVLPEFQNKERALFNRIKHHRVDPTSSSMANPVPDYYGEKIDSVQAYRRWLKDQRAFNLKRGAYRGEK